VLSWISTVSAMPLPPARFGGRAGKVVAEPGAAAPAQPASGSVTIVWHVVSKADEIRARVTSSLHLG